MSNWVRNYLLETSKLIRSIDYSTIELAATLLHCSATEGGRLFILGLGGSAGHASHAVNDFRKICGIQAFTPTDNVSELTARINDEGWDTCFTKWLELFRPTCMDTLLVFSVGGGAKNVSTPLVNIMDYAKERGMVVLSIVGKDGGHAKEVSDACIVIPPLYEDRITPHTEGLCAVVWHLLVSHPLLKLNQTKWEGMK